ncbi:hypothetical protein AVEN_77004-1 [Araneus ventricosus]|uniref:ribonuclease H n=1 Tax=Araneus ventricosus TaxID=182803 RepID=A0A4Y2VLF3_ARAVE|nr:hypothetical protein AVEN_77004-1 [Araneus ventricosus]
MLSAHYHFRIQSVANHPLQHLSLPIGLRRLYLARSFNILPFCERIKTAISHAGLGDVTIKQKDLLIFPPWSVPCFSYVNPFSSFDKSSTAPIIFQQLFASHRHRFSSFVSVFTDGSKSEGYVGCGIFFPPDTYSYRLHASCSVLTVELAAVFYALQKIAASRQSLYCIYTDSMSALEALCHADKRMHPVAEDIFCYMRELQAQGFKILFCWVPSHVGIVGNEQADSAAKAASNVWQSPVPCNDLKIFATHHIHSLWQELWDLEIHITSFI